LGLDAIKDRDMQILPISCLTGDGFPQILQWFRDNFGKGKRAEVKSNVEKKDPEKTLLEKWLEVEDEPDEEFLRKFRDYSLETWDHRTHLRIAWIYITVHGRKYGIRLIFDGIKNFIANSERTRKTTFNETMTYFW
jgi:ADP-ribosylation factor protein 1